MARWSNVSFAVIPGDDHILRPLAAQRFVHDALDRALELELERPLAATTGATAGAGVTGAEQPARGAGGQVVRMINTEQGA